MITDNMTQYFTALVRKTAIAVYTLLLTTSIVTNAHASDKIIPMGEWAEFTTVVFDGKPLLVHLRTGYERAIMFPEPITLQSINDVSVHQGGTPELPNCNIELDTDVLGFSPLERFGTQRVAVRGVESGHIYILFVSSSPNGKRQPIHLIK